MTSATHFVGDTCLSDDCGFFIACPKYPIKVYETAWKATKMKCLLPLKYATVMKYYK